MRHKSLVLTVKNFLQSVYIYGSYRKIKTGVPFFGPPGIYIDEHGTLQRIRLRLVVVKSVWSVWNSLTIIMQNTQSKRCN